MNDTQHSAPPSVLTALITDTDALGFPTASEIQKLVPCCERLLRHNLVELFSHLAPALVYQRPGF